MINKENFAKAITLLESLDDKKFHMETWLDNSYTAATITFDEAVHNCGTVGCIGGWIDAMIKAEQASVLQFDVLRFKDFTGEDAAARWLGLVWEGKPLFYAHNRPCRISLSMVTRQNAINVLKDMLARDSDDPDWTENGPAGWSPWQIEGFEDEDRYNEAHALEPERSWPRD